MMKRSFSSGFARSMAMKTALVIIAKSTIKLKEMLSGSISGTQQQHTKDMKREPTANQRKREVT